MPTPKPNRLTAQIVLLNRLKKARAMGEIGFAASTISQTTARYCGCQEHRSRHIRPTPRALDTQNGAYTIE